MANTTVRSRSSLVPSTCEGGPKGTYTANTHPTGREPCSSLAPIESVLKLVTINSVSRLFAYQTILSLQVPTDIIGEAKNKTKITHEKKRKKERR